MRTLVLGLLVESDVLMFLDVALFNLFSELRVLRLDLTSSFNSYR